MALILKDRVQETATANTTVSFSLAGASTGYQTFSAAIGNTNTTYYGASDGTNWEVGIGTYATTGNLLNRTTILSSSNAGSAVTFSGTVTVFVDYPSGKSVYLDASNNASALGTPAAFVATNVTGLPISTGVSGLGTGVATALGVNTETAGAFVVNGGALGTPSSGTVTNLTGTASININGTVGATTQTTGRFTSIDCTSVTDTSALARNGGKTANTTINNTTTYTTGGVTLATQSAATGSVWRVRAFGQYTAANSATARTARVACFWGATQLTAITSTVLTGTAQTTQWQCEFTLTASSATAIWTTGTMIGRTASATALAIDNATPASTTGLTTTSTLDLRFSMSSATPADSWIVQSVTMERLE